MIAPTPPPLPPGAALGICGFSGAGKTTLIEAVLPALRERGLDVAVVKHDVHRLDIDRPHKDSARLFAAGADVFLHGSEHFARLHGHRSLALATELAILLDHYHLVLVEGYKHTDIPKLWLPGPDNDPPPPEVRNILGVLPRDGERPARLLAFLDTWLAERCRTAPTWGCILMGGASRRMGTAKHLLTVADGRTWLEVVHDALAPHVQGVVLCGTGGVPDNLAHLPRLADIPGCRGPLAGILAASRWHPHTDWLVASCDLPLLDDEAVAWLLGERRPHLRAVVPRTDRPQPLLAWYSRRAQTLLEELGREGEPRLMPVTAAAGVATPQVPEKLRPAWTNVNSPADLAAAGIRRPPA